MYDNAPSASSITESKHFSSISSGYSVNAITLTSATDSDSQDTISLYSAEVSNGSISVSRNQVTYTPTYGFVGISIITLNFTDGLLHTAVTWSLSVTNNAPVAVPFSTNIHWTQSETLIDVLSSITDSDGDSISFTITSSSNAFGTPSIVAVGSQNEVKWTLPTTPVLGTTSFTIQYTDGWNSKNATYSVVISNNAPVATVKSINTHWTAYSTGVSIDVLSGCTDADSDTLSIAAVTSTSSTHGTVSISSAKALYKPTQGYVGIASFTYTVTDGIQNATQTVTCNVTNSIPVAVADSVSLHWATGYIDISVLSNDIDSDAEDTLSISSITQPSEGTTSVIGSTIRYNVTNSSNPSLGPKTFTYKATDGAQTSSSATVTVTITNTATPSASSQTSTNHWRSVQSGITYSIYSSPTDSNGDTLTLTVASNNSYCSVVTAGSVKVVQYTRSAFVGSDSCIFTLSDGLSQVSNSLTTISYNNIPVAPNITYNYYATNIQSGLTIDAVSLSTDNDVADTAYLAIQSVSKSTLYSSDTNTVTISSGKVKYFPTSSLVTQVGVDTFTYTITDGLNTATGTITINIVSTTPTAAEQYYDIHWRASLSGGVVLDVLSSINSTTTLTLAKVLPKQPSNGGSVVVSSDLLNVTYTPAAYFTGTETFILSYSNQAGYSNITVTCTVYDNFPTASALTGTTHWTNAKEFNLAANVSDSDASDVPYLTTYVGTSPFTGTFAVVNNVGTYTPSSTIGSLSFSYKVSDGLKNTSALISMTVTNTAPTASAKAKTILWSAFKTGFDLNVLTMSPADSDSDGDSIYVKSVTQPTVGTVTKKNDTSVTVIGSSSTYIGTVSFSYVVTDGASNGDVSNSITLTVYNTAPVANADTVTVHWNTSSLIIDVLANDVDADGDSITIIQVYGSSAGTAPIISNNKIVYYPNTASLGNDTFTYIISDGVTTSTATVKVSITNNKPTTQSLSFTGLWSQAQNGVLFGVIGNSSDADSDSLSISSFTSISTSEGTLSTVDSGRTIKYVPKTGYVGTVTTITFVVSDGKETASGTITITVNNNVPTANVTLVTYHWRTLLSNTTINLSSRFYDSDGDSVSISAITKTNQGSVALGSNNVVIYKLSNAWKGTDTFTVFYTDGWSSSTATFTVVSYNNAPNASSFVVSSHFSNAYTLSIPVIGRTDGNQPTDSDSVDVSNLVVSSYTNTTSGTLALSSDKKTFTFNNPSGNLISQSFSYVISDGLDTSATKAITITLQNSAPSASAYNNTYHWANVQSGILYNVLAGASDSDGDSLSLSYYGQPGSGTVTQYNTTTLKYTPIANTAGFTTSFQYKISDGAETTLQTVTITITDTAPLAVADSYTFGWRNKSIALTPTSNDYDSNGDSFYISSVDSASSTRSAFLSIGTDKKTIAYNYTGTLGSGTDSFKYTITDGVYTSSAIVSLTFINTEPVAPSSSATVKWSSSITFSNTLANCTDGENDPLTFAGIVQGSLGTTVVTSSTTGTFTYTPSSSITYTTIGSQYKVTDTIKYGCSDGALATYGSISIIIVNSPPTSGNKTTNITRNCSNPTATFIDLLTGAVDADGDTITISSVSLFSNQDTGASVILNSDGSVKLTYSNSYLGIQQFYFTITDRQLSNTYIYTVNITGSALNCVDYYISTTKSTTSVQFEDALRLNLVKVSGSEPSTITLGTTSTLNGVGSISLSSSKLTYFPNSTRSCLNNACYATYSYANSAGQTVACRIYVTQPNQSPNAPSYTYEYSVSRSSNIAQTLDYLSLSGASDGFGFGL